MQTKYIISIGASILISQMSLLAEETNYLLKDQNPTLHELRFVYQMVVLNENFIWDKERQTYTVTDNGKRIRQNIINICTKNVSYETMYQLKTENEIFKRYCFSAYNVRAFRKDGVEGDRWKQSIIALSQYCTENNFSRFQPLPEEIIPVSDQIVNDFSYRNYKDIFNRKIARTYLRTPKCEGLPCSISVEDVKNINRLMTDTSSDKTVLFVGFEQSSPEEGSEITFETPGYRKSLFWSLWGDRLGKNRNAIKMCFCQCQNLLNQFPNLENFFDYIIIGGQTIEYITTDAWITLAKMVKPGGRIVYPKCEYFFFGRFLNRLFNEGTTDNFNLYLCANKEERIFCEILQLASFNDRPCYGSFFYKGAEELCWHRKSAKKVEISYWFL